MPTSCSTVQSGSFSFRARISGSVYGRPACGQARSSPTARSAEPGDGRITQCGSTRGHLSRVERATRSTPRPTPCGFQASTGRSRWSGTHKQRLPYDEPARATFPNSLSAARAPLKRPPDPADDAASSSDSPAKGRDLIGRAGPTRLETERRMLDPLTRREQAELARLLRKLRIGLEKQLGIPRHRASTHADAALRLARRRNQRQSAFSATPAAVSASLRLR